MIDIKKHYYNIGYREGYYNVRMANILEQNTEIRKYYISGYADGKTMKSMERQYENNELYNQNRLNYIREIGYNVGYEDYAASSSRLKTDQDEKAFNEGLESGKKQREIDNMAIKEYQKMRERK